MKKYLLILSCLAFGITCTNAQNTFRSSIANFSYPRSLVMTKDSGWVIGETIDRSNNFLNGHSRLSLLDKKGILKATENFNFDSTDIGHIAKLLTDTAGNIYALANFFIHCDIIVDNVNIVYKFDKNLKLLWERKIFFNQASPGYDHGGFTFDSKNNLLVTNGGTINTIDPGNGSDIKKDSISTDFFADIFVLNNGDRLLASRDLLIKTDNNSKIIWSRKLSNQYVKNLGNNLFAVLQNDTIILIDSGVKVINIYVYGASLIDLYDIASNGTNIYCTGRRSYSDSMSVLLKFDMSLHLLSHKTIQRITTANVILAYTNLLAIAGTDMTDDQQMRTELLVTDTAINTLPLADDIGIVRIIPGKFSSFNNTGSGILNELDLDVVVKNYGTTTVQNFSAYTDGSTGTFCTSTDPEIAFTGMNLAPGDTARLTLGTFYYQQYVKADAVFKVCAYTCSPNQHVDKNPHNDFVCDTFVYSGIEDQAMNKADIRIFPNPASNILNIESDRTLFSNYEVINTLGQTLTSGKITNATKATLNIEALPAGVYYVQLHDAKNVSQLKFVKE